MKTVLAVLVLLALTVTAAYGAPVETAGVLLVAGAAAGVPLDLATVGFGHSPKAYADENGKPVTHAPLAVLANHHYAVEGDDLVHYVEGVERARVGAAGMREYAECWPDCAPIVKRFLSDARAPGASSPTAPARKARKGPKAKTRA